MPFTPHELTAEHARAMRIVKAVLTACDARSATAQAAREHKFKPGDAPWLLAIGKAAIGMAEGIKDVCGSPQRHLIITVDGPPARSLPSILRSDHPLPTQRSLNAGQAVKRFIQEAKAAKARSLTVLISGGASSLICEPIPGIDLDDYRAIVQALLTGGWTIGPMNTVRRAIDELKGGGLAALARPLPVDLLVISDVIGDTLHDIGSGPFVESPTTPVDAAHVLNYLPSIDCLSGVRTALSRRTVPRGFSEPRRAIIALTNAHAVTAAADALASDGFDVLSRSTDVQKHVEDADSSENAVIRLLQQGRAAVWGGEWSFENAPADSAGGRCQALALMTDVRAGRSCVLSFATDGVDGRAAPGCPPAAGAFLYEGMSWPPVSAVGKPHPSYQLAMAADPDDPSGAEYRWRNKNSYLVLAYRDAHRLPHEPPAHIFTGPTGTNVNDLLIAWRVR